MKLDNSGIPFFGSTINKIEELLVVSSPNDLCLVETMGSVFQFNYLRLACMRRFWLRKLILLLWFLSSFQFKLLSMWWFLSTIFAYWRWAFSLIFLLSSKVSGCSYLLGSISMQLLQLDGVVFVALAHWLVKIVLAVLLFNVLHFLYRYLFLFFWLL